MEAQRGVPVNIFGSETAISFRVSDLASVRPAILKYKAAKSEKAWTNPGTWVEML